MQMMNAQEKLSGKPLSAHMYQQGAQYIASIILVTLGGILITLAIMHISPSMWTNILSLGFSLLILLLGILSFRETLRHNGEQIQVYEYGLVYTQRRKSTTIMWKQITHIRYNTTKYRSPIFNHTGNVSGFRNNIMHDYVVIYDDGKKITINQHTDRHLQLGKLIEEKTLPYLLERARATFQRGERQFFGVISVSDFGLSDGKKALRWKDLQDIHVDEEQGIITIESTGKWRRPWSKLDLSDVENFRVFTLLVNEIMGN